MAKEGVVLIGEAAQRYVDLKYLEFYASLPLLFLFICILLGLVVGGVYLFIHRDD